jgi:hypothetical protein
MEFAFLNDGDKTILATLLNKTCLSAVTEVYSFPCASFWYDFMVPNLHIDAMALPSLSRAEMVLAATWGRPRQLDI